MARHVIDCGCSRIYRLRWLRVPTPSRWDLSIRGDRRLRIFVDKWLVEGRSEFCARH